MQTPRRLLAELLFHASPELAHLLEVRRRRLGPVDEGLDGPAHGPPEARIAAHEARARQGLALPRVRPFAVVLAKRREARGEAAALGAGTEAQVHGDDHAGRGDVTQDGREGLHGAVVEHVGLDALEAIRLPRPTVDHEEIEVGACRQLASSELAEPDDAGGDEPAGRVQGNTESCRRLVEGHEPARGQRRFRQRRHLPREAIRVGDSEKQPPDDAQLLGLLEPAQPVHALELRQPRGQGRSQGASEVRPPSRRREGGGIGQPVQQLRLRQQQLGQELAASAELDEVREQVGTIGEELEIRGARSRRGDEALELVERLIRIGALPEGVEEHGRPGAWARRRGREGAPRGRAAGSGARGRDRRSRWP